MIKLWNLLSLDLTNGSGKEAFKVGLDKIMGRGDVKGNFSEMEPRILPRIMCLYAHDQLEGSFWIHLASHFRK